MEVTRTVVNNTILLGCISGFVTQAAQWVLSWFLGGSLRHLWVLSQSKLYNVGNVGYSGTR